MVGVLFCELVGLFWGLTPTAICVLTGEGDWLSPERTGMRDWLPRSGTEGLRSTEKKNNNKYGVFMIDTFTW